MDRLDSRPVTTSADRDTMVLVNEQRVAGQERLDRIVVDRLSGEPVDQGPMFSTTGWRHGGKVFAFVGASGELMIKLPEARVRALVDSAAGEPMTIRERTMREWVRIPPEGDWEPLVVEAHAFLAG
jgi:hypothetical protein